MAAATAAVFGLWAANTMALSLGRITVQSAIGEPLRAEIDIPDINAEEASTLKAIVGLEVRREIQQGGRLRFLGRDIARSAPDGLNE